MHVLYYEIPLLDMSIFKTHTILIHSNHNTKNVCYEKLSSTTNTEVEFYRLRQFFVFLNLALVGVATGAFIRNSQLELFTTSITRTVKHEMGSKICFPIPVPRNVVPNNLTRCIEYDLTRNPATFQVPVFILLIVVIDLVASICFYSRTFHDTQFLGRRRTGEREKYVWLNYALTSPFQVLLVALLWFISDSYVLAMLFVAQFALILCGDVCERCYAIMSKEKENTEARNNANNIILYTQINAWSLFWVIWGVLLSNFAQVQKEFALDGMPGELIGIIIGQFLLFMAFGVHSLILWYMSYYKKDINWDLQSLIHMGLSSIAKGILASCYLVYVLRVKKV